MARPALFAMADDQLMLEEACCVPLVDVQRHREEEMHILPYLALRGLTSQLEVASICSIVTSVEVAMFVDVTSFKRSGVAMAIVRKAGMLLV